MPYGWELVLSYVPIKWRVINMNIMTSFIFLVTPCDSLSTMVKHSGLTGCPVEWLWWCTGDGGPEVFLEPVPKGFAWFPYAFFQTVDVWAFKSIHDPNLLVLVVPVIGSHKKGIMVLVPLKCTWIHKLLHALLNHSPCQWMYATTMEILLLFDPLLLLGWLSVVVCPL